MKRYADEVIICYDADEAGQKATARAIPILRNSGLNVKVLTIPSGKDPDEFIKGLGAQALEERIRKAMSSFMFQVKVAAGRYDQDDPESKTQFQHEAAKLLATIEEPLERKNYIEAVSREYYIGAQILKDLGAKSLRLLTNNPDKVYQLKEFGMQITERIPIQMSATEYGIFYLQTKQKRMGHMLKYR